MKFEQWWANLPEDLRRAYAGGGVHACQVAFNAGRDAAQAHLPIAREQYLLEVIDSKRAEIVALRGTVSDLESAAQASAAPSETPAIARALAEWHEDDGPVTWWAWCGKDWAGEPPWVGTPLDSDWPGYHTHWTKAPQTPQTKG